MTAGAQHIDIVFVHIDRDLPEGLYGVGVEQDVMFMRDPSDLPDRFDRPDLVVGCHDGNEDRFRRDRFFDRFRIDKTVFVDVEIGDLRAALFEILAGVQHGMMLDLRGDDMVPFRGISFKSGLERPVVGFTAAGGEIDLIFLCADHVRDLLPCPADRFFASSRDLIKGRGIAVVLRKIREHGRDDFRRGLCGCCIVKINIRTHKVKPPVYFVSQTNPLSQAISVLFAQSCRFFPSESRSDR